MTKKLFSPITIGNLQLKNRITMAPMLTKEADSETNTINDFHKVHYGARAIGGVGLIMIEGTSINKEGLITEQDLGLWNNDQRDKLKELVTLVHNFGSKIGVQLSHAGRKAYDGQVENLVAPSAIAYSADFNTPRELSTEDIASIKNQFVNSAKLASEAGVDVIEIHLAHGYLLNQFLSPLTNKREDNYGGSLEKRYALIHEIITEMKKVYSGSLWARLSANEYDENGTTMDEFIQIASWLKEDGIDLIDISSGGVVPKRPDNIYPGYQVPLARQIKEKANIPVAAVGLLNDANLAEFVLESNSADLITLGRPLLSNPNWLTFAAKTLGVEKDLVVFNDAYERGKRL